MSLGPLMKLSSNLARAISSCFFVYSESFPLKTFSKTYRYWVKRQLLWDKINSDAFLSTTSSLCSRFWVQAFYIRRGELNFNNVDFNLTLIHGVDGLLHVCKGDGLGGFPTVTLHKSVETISYKAIKNLSLFIRLDWSYK